MSIPSSSTSLHQILGARADSYTRNGKNIKRALESDNTATDLHRPKRSLPSTQNIAPKPIVAEAIQVQSSPRESHSNLLPSQSSAARGRGPFASREPASNPTNSSIRSLAPIPTASVVPTASALSSDSWTKALGMSSFGGMMVLTK